MASKGDDMHGLLDRSYDGEKDKSYNSRESPFSRFLRRYRPYMLGGVGLVVVIYITSTVTLYLRDKSEESQHGSSRTVDGCEDWKKINEAAYKRMLKRRVRDYEDPSLADSRPKTLEYWTPTYSCPFEERLGTIRDGGKWICMPTTLNKNSVVYSVGSNAIISFEEDVHALCKGCQIHTFDMTIKESRMQIIRDAEAKGVLTFHPVGLGHVEDTERKIKTIDQIMAELGHKYIDIFKVDCEGCEWDFFATILPKFPPVLFGQILVEVHSFFDPPNSTKLFSSLEEAGYRMFHYEVNLYSSRSIEISYIHESLVKP